MEFRRVGRSGLSVSLVGLGCNNFGMLIDKDAASEVVAAALDSGITHFDTADIYGGGRSEELLGNALGSRRDEVVIATKFAAPTGEGPYRSGASRRYILRACEASLRRLDTDYIDLYYLHYPDSATPMEETLETLSDLVHEGKVRYIGSSNLAGWKVADADHVSRAHGAQRFVAAQIEWNLLQRDAEREVVPACRHYDIGIVPYFPLASGMLTGKYHRGEDFPAGSRLASMAYFTSIATDENFGKVERLTALAAEHGHTILEVALGWLASQPGVSSVVVGATRAEQVVSNVAAFDAQLGHDVLTAVEDAVADRG